MKRLLLILSIIAALSSAAFAVTGDVTIEGRLGVSGIVNVGLGNVGSEEMLNIYGNLRIGTTESGTVVASKELVLRQDGDTFGSSILRLRNRNGENGAIYETNNPTITLIDFIFKTADVSGQRNIRLEARPASARTGDPSFHIGGGTGAVADPDNPSLSVGDSYVAVAKKLSIGTYASFDAALAVSGDATVTGVVTANAFSGSGANITSLDAGQLVSGTVADTRLTTNVVTLGASQTLTNKAIIATSNNVAANSLKTATGTVDVASATAPVAGQYLRASSGTTSAWQVPATSESVAYGTTYEVVTTTATQRILVLAKGDILPGTATVSVTLEAPIGTRRDTVTIASSNATNRFGFCLFYTDVPGAVTRVNMVRTTAGTLANVKIMVLKIDQ